MAELLNADSKPDTFTVTVFFQLRYSDFTKLTKHYEASFWRDLDTLKVLRPSMITRVSDHIPDIIHFIQKIISNGHAYVTPLGQ